MLQMKHMYVKNVKFSKLNQAKYFHQKKNQFNYYFFN